LIECDAPLVYILKGDDFLGTNNGRYFGTDFEFLKLELNEEVK
jgi:hypothetical protein